MLQDTKNFWGKNVCSLKMLTNDMAWKIMLCYPRAYWEIWGILGNAKESLGIKFYGSFFKLLLGTLQNVNKCLKVLSNAMEFWM